jgi:hypothetical protein
LNRSLLRPVLLLTVAVEGVVCFVLVLWLVCLRLALAGMMHRALTFAAGGLVAAACLVLAWRLFQTARRRRFQYSLRTLLLVTTALSVLLSIVVPSWRQVRERDAVERAISVISRLNGTIVVGRPAEAPADTPLHLMDRRYSVGVSFDGAILTDADFVELSGLKPLSSISFQGAQLDEHGLLHLERLPYLCALWFRDTPIAPVVVAQFANDRPDCEMFFVFENTQVSPSAVSELGAVGSNCRVFRSDTEMRKCLSARAQEQLKGRKKSGPD